MIVAIERNSFYVLFKYDFLRIDWSHVLDLKSTEILESSEFESGMTKLIQEFDNILPTFESDHEILILEIDKEKANCQGHLEIFLSSVKKIVPLSSIAVNLLHGKLNDNLIVEKPIFESIIERVQINRSLKNRSKCASTLIEIFDLSNHVDSKFRADLHETVSEVLSPNSSKGLTILRELISYDKNPAFLPSGNTEHILKIGLIAMNIMGRDESILKNGPYYKECKENIELLNSGGILSGYSNLQQVAKNNFELKDSIDKIKDLVNKEFHQIDLFETAYFYLAIKSYLFKNEKNLLGIAKHLKALTVGNEQTIAHCLLLIGYTFSVEELYESIHVLHGNPLMKNKFQLKENATTNSWPNELISPRVEEECKEISKPEIINEQNTIPIDKNSIKNKKEESSKTSDPFESIEPKNNTIEWDFNSNKSITEESTSTQSVESNNSNIISSNESLVSKENDDLSEFEKEQFNKASIKELNDVNSNEVAGPINESATPSPNYLNVKRISEQYISVTDLESKIIKLISTKKIQNNWKKLLTTAFPDPLVEVSPNILLEVINNSKFQEEELFKFGNSSVNHNKELILANLSRD